MIVKNIIKLNSQTMTIKLMIIGLVSLLFCECNNSQPINEKKIDKRPTSKSAKESGEHPKNKAVTNAIELVPGYEKGAILATEDFSENLGDWLTEGKVIARIDSGQLYMESHDADIENPKGNIWWKHDFKNPYVIEFDYQSLSNEGLTMVFWNAFGIDGKDIFSWKRTGKYEEYVSSNLTAYHCSFHRFSTGSSNIRKAPGFHLVSSVKDPIDTKDRNMHRIMIASADNRQRIFVDGQLVHDFIDEGKPCINEKEWQHPLPCKSTGSVPMHGAFGIRLTQKQKIRIDNIKVYQLE